MVPTRKVHVKPLLLLAALAAPQLGLAAFDGTSNLVCTVNDAVGCHADGACTVGRTRAFDLPDFFVADFAQKQVRPASDSGHSETSPFEKVAFDTGNLIVQGVENGHAWSLIISQKNGQFTAAIGENAMSYSLFGRKRSPPPA